MTDKQPEALREAIEWLETSPTTKDKLAAAELRRLHEENETLRARLAQPKQDPVVWVAYENGEKHGIDFDEDEIAKLPVGTMLYTEHASPQRIWQGLTDEEIQNMWSDHCKNWQKAEKILISPTVFGHAIEAKLKAKNA